MAFRVARGLFRLWLVLSVLWIAGVGVVTWQHFPIQLSYTPGKVPPGEFDPDRFLLSHEHPDFDPSKPYDNYKERRDALQFASVLAFVPPAFVLALGSALVWAFRGFR